MPGISSQGTILMISDDPDAVQHPATAATKAAPCVITVTAPTAVVGDIVIPRNTGWASIEGMPFKVSAVATGAVTLEDSDTSGETNDFPTTGAKVSEPTFTELCRSNINANSPAGATIDVTTLCDIAHRIVPGLPGVGTWTAAGFFDDTEAGNAALFVARDLARKQAKAPIDVRLNNGKGWTFMATVNTFDLTAGVNAAIGANIGGQIDGSIHFYKTPAADFVPLDVRMGRAVPPPPPDRPAVVA